MFEGGTLYFEDQHNRYKKIDLSRKDGVITLSTTIYDDMGMVIGEDRADYKHCDHISITLGHASLFSLLGFKQKIRIV